MFRFKCFLARATGRLSRFFGRGGGTALPGKVLMHLDQRAVEKIAACLGQGSAVISATNGKTTTANMVGEILRQGGQSTVHNSAGANLISGVATALLAADAETLPSKLGLFEVDEAALAPVADQLKPRLFLLSNLFRDQLDRYGELEQLADLWAKTLSMHCSGSEFILCADDPLIADLGREDEIKTLPLVTYFGIEDATHSLPSMQYAADSKHCRACGSAYIYSSILLGHLGHYSCPDCGRLRPTPAYTADEIQLNGIDGCSFTLSYPDGSLPIELPLPGVYNIYNALAAATCALKLGAEPADVKLGLESFKASFGRAEKVELDGIKAVTLLIKNPTGANEVLRTLLATDSKLNLLIALNDKIADGRDISWIWDADFEVIAGQISRVVCSGSRADELALRLKYAGVDPELVTSCSNLESALDVAISIRDEGYLYLLPTYTALLELKQILHRRGHSERYWQAEKAGERSDV